MKKKKYFGFHLSSDRFFGIPAVSREAAFEIFINEVKCCEKCKVLIRWVTPDIFSYIIIHPSEKSFSSPETVSVEVYEE